jgi:hypothetical protein
MPAAIRTLERCFACEALVNSEIMTLVRFAVLRLQSSGRDWKDSVTTESGVVQVLRRRDTERR